MEYLAIAWAQVVPHLPELMGLVVTVAVSVAAAQVKRWTGVQVEEKHMRALHEALTTGAVIAVKGNPKRAVSNMIEIAVAHAMSSVPDAIRTLAPDADVLRRIAERKVREITG